MRSQNTAQIYRIYEALSKEYPNVTSKLLEPRRGNPVDVLIATVLSQATNDILSERAFENLKSNFPTWEKVLEADSLEIEKALSCGGLQKEKSKKIKAILSRLKEDFGDITLEPLRTMGKEEAFKYLAGLPGVGPKTSACTLVFGLGKPAFPVDTHILRILKRLGFFQLKDSAAKVQKEMETRVPDELKLPLHVMLINHGREVCHPRKPLCGRCCIGSECRFVSGKETDGEKVN